MRLRPRGAPGGVWGALALAVAVAAFGCGGKAGSKGTVSGTVTYKGAKLKGGRVTFAVDGKSAVGDIKEDGTYTAEDVPTGKAKVLVETNYLQQMARQMSKVKMNKPPKDAKVPEGYKMSGPDTTGSQRYTKIPDKYEDPANTPLSYDVKKGPNTFDIKLE